MVTSNAVLAMALDDLDHSSHIAEMKNQSHIAEMEGMAKTIKELKDNMTRFRLSNFYFLCWGRNMRSGLGV